MVPGLTGPIFFPDFALFKDYYYVSAGVFIDLLACHGDISKIPFPAGKKSIVIDAASDPWHNEWILDLAKNCKQSGLVSSIIACDRQFAEKNQDVNLRWCPVLALRCAAMARQLAADFTLGHQRRYRVSCLNRKPRLHRAYVFYVLSQQSWFPYVFKSFYGLSNHGPITGENLDDISLDKIRKHFGKSAAGFFRDNQTQFPLSDQPAFDWDNCHSPLTTGFADTYLNIATESCCHNYCPTEKIFKPIIAGTLCMPVASHNFVKGLLDLGLDIRYQGLELPIIDDDPDWKRRIEKTIDHLDNIYDQIEDIWYTNQKQIMYNNELLKSGHVETLALASMRDHL